MWLDVIDLRDFYASPLGRVARRMIRERIRNSWPDVTGQTVVGVGFATLISVSTGRRRAG